MNAIEFKNVTKRFGHVVANDHISFGIEEGEIHALAGENGAGKSTLMNMLFGLLTPDEGSILVREKEMHFASPREANRNGIGMVHQHFMLIPKMPVYENVIVGVEPCRRNLINRKEAIDKVQQISDQYQLSIDCSRPVGDLTVPEQQRVEIIKILYRKANILIFDEPTAVLGPQQIDEFCEILLNLKRLGKTIIFISHKLPEVMRVADRVTVIRRGKVVGTRPIRDINTEILTTMMVGHKVNTGRKPRKPVNLGGNALELNNLWMKDHYGIEKLKGLSLVVRNGEILGIAGVDGNGQDELDKCILGVYTPDSGTICMNGMDVTHTSIKQRRDMGLGYVASDRQKESLILSYSVADNLILGQQRKSRFIRDKFLMDREAIWKNAETIRKRYDIRCASVSVAARTLSGGNQQKIVVAREAESNPNIYVAIQPTRGLDIGAADDVLNTLMDMRNAGKGVLFVSMELDELLSVSDRIAVIFEGHIVDIVNPEEVSREDIGKLMLGVKGRI